MNIESIFYHQRIVMSVNGICESSDIYLRCEGKSNYCGR